jgi:UDP-N-acetylglucosamine transferase subunit ALG13
MITLTLGTIPYSFERAINWLNILLCKNVITEPVFVQHGITDVSSIAAHPLVVTESVVGLTELVAQVKQSRLVISHAGQGSTSLLAAQGASFILLPRLAQYKEHIDDHQLLFAKSVRQYGIQYCVNKAEVEQAILCPPPPFQGRLFNGSKLSDYLRDRYATQPSLQRQERRWSVGNFSL